MKTHATVIDRRYNLARSKRMGDRAVYCARLESVCAERHRGFESPPIRVSSPALNRAPARAR
jgi:hypothetical protein